MTDVTDAMEVDQISEEHAERESKALQLEAGTLHNWANALTHPAW